MDWTFDLFMEDARAYHETPMKGVYCEDTSNYRKYFMVWYKNAARDFKAKWLENHAHLYDKHDGWIGDAFASTLMDWFSDFYKDAYGQRPHLPNWYYVQAVGFPSREDVGRTFCATPVEDAEEEAKRVREAFEKEATASVSLDGDDWWDDIPEDMAEINKELGKEGFWK